MDDILIGIPVDRNGQLNYNVRNFNGRLCLNFSLVLASRAASDMPEVRVRVRLSRTLYFPLTFPLKLDITL